MRSPRHSSCWLVIAAAGVAAEGSLDENLGVSHSGSGAVGGPLRRHLQAEHSNANVNGAGGKKPKKKDADLFYEFNELAPYTIGDEYNITSSSSGDFAPVYSPDFTEATYTLTHPGATCMALRFATWELAHGRCAATIGGAQESIVMTDDANGRKQQSGVGDPIWSDHVYGETITLIVTCKKGGDVRTETSVEADMYVACSEDAEQDEDAAEPPTARMRRTRTRRQRRANICNQDDRVNAVCHEPSPSEVEWGVSPAPYNNTHDASRAVARLIIGSKWQCTGFLVSGSRHIITDHHCLDNSEKKTVDQMAKRTEVQFMAERSKCKANNCQMCGVKNAEYVHCVKGSATLKLSDYKLDYAVMQIDEARCYDKFGNRTSQSLEDLFGYIPVAISADTPAVANGEQIYITQHPKARAKEVASSSDSSPGSAGGGQCVVESDDVDSCIGSSNFKQLGYRCDTEGGSSGSPVISPSKGHVAVGLHNCGGGNDCGDSNGGLNRAVKFSDICSDICKRREYLCRVICRGP